MTFDWSKYNANGNEEHRMTHSQAEHEEAHGSQYNDIFQVAMVRFQENFEAFMTHYDDKDPKAPEYFMHLFESAVIHAMNDLIEQARVNDGEFDEVAACFAGAGFGFVLGRTFQEYETRHLIANGDLQPMAGTPKAL